MKLTLIALAARAVCGPRPRELTPLELLMRRFVRPTWTVPVAAPWPLSP